MVNIKTATEIEKMRVVGALAAEQLEMMQLADTLQPYTLQVLGLTVQNTS